MHEAPDLERAELHEFDVRLHRDGWAYHQTDWLAVGIATRTALVRRTGPRAAELEPYEPRYPEEPGVVNAWLETYTRFHPSEQHPIVSVLVDKVPRSLTPMRSAGCPMYP